MDTNRVNLERVTQSLVGVKRELLGNLHEEERALMGGNAQLAQNLFYQRVNHLKRVEVLEKERITIMNGIDDEEQIDCEIIILEDQLTLLDEKISHQNLRNKTLQKMDFLPLEEEIQKPQEFWTAIDEGDEKP